MNRQDRLALLVASLLTGRVTPGDQLIEQVITIAEVILRKIEESQP